MSHYSFTRLRQEASVRNIVRELSAAKPIQVIRLLAYRNGEGHVKSGQLLIGSSIIGVRYTEGKAFSFFNDNI